MRDVPGTDLRHPRVFAVRSVAYRLTHVFSEAIKHKSFEMDAEKIRNLLIEAANTIFQLAARECRREFGDRISLGGGPKRSISPPLNIGPLPSEMSAAINNNRVRMLVQSVR